jgi:hypothetical protein
MILFPTKHRSLCYKIKQTSHHAGCIAKGKKQVERKIATTHK